MGNVHALAWREGGALRAGSRNGCTLAGEVLLMRKLFLLVPLASLLAGCGFIANSIPDQEVGDVFGIGSPEKPSVVVAATFADPAELGPFLPASSAASEYEETELRFEDIELPIMYGFTIDGLRVVVGLGETVKLERDGAAGEFPDAFTLTSFEGYMRVVDAEDVVAPVAIHFEAQPLGLEFVRDGACSGGECSYRAVAGAEERQEAMIFDVLTGQQVKSLFRLVSAGGQNTAHVKVRVTAESGDDLVGFKPVVQIMNSSTKVSIGG